MAEPEGSKRAQEATLSARPSDPRLREAQRLHHEERKFQRQADEANQQRGAAASEVKDLTIAKAARQAEIDQLSKAVDDARQKLFEARDRVKALELEALSVEKSDPGKAADIRESAAVIRADIPELEKFAGTHDAKLQEAWDQVKDMEARLETRTADVAKFADESERLRKLADERESAAEALEQQRAAEPLRPEVPEIEIFEPDRLREALRNGHRVVLGEDGHIRVSEERGQPMTDEQMDYLESKLPELRHRLGEGWSFSIQTDGSIDGNGPWSSHYFASSNGQISEQTLAEVRARVGQGQDISIAPDGTVVTSDPATAVSADQARRNLEAFNREVESGALTERMGSGQGYDLNPDGTGGYSAIGPMTETKVADPAPTGEQQPEEKPGMEPSAPATPADDTARPASASDDVKALEDRARALREDLAEAKDRRIDIEDRIYSTHRAAELAYQGAESAEAEAKTLRDAARTVLDKAAEYEKEADEADAAGKIPEAQELREKVAAAMADAKANTEIAARRTDAAERFRAEVAKNEAENQAFSKQRAELNSTLKKSETAIDSLETKASILRQSDTVRTAAEGLERSAMAERASGNEPGARAMEVQARDMRLQADTLRTNAEAVQVDETTLKALEDLTTETKVDQGDPMPPEEPAGGTKTSIAPATDEETPKEGTEVASAPSDQDVTGEVHAEEQEGTDLEGLDGAGASAGTAMTEQVTLDGQDSQDGQAAEAQEPSTSVVGADADVGSHEDPYDDQAFTTPEPVPTYADSQATESYDSYDEGSEETTV